MACFHPLHAYQTHVGGKLSYFLNSSDPDYQIKLKKWQEVYDSQTEFPRAVLVPCQQCLGCRLTYSRNWAIRCLLEAKMHPEHSCWFVTLTYDDVHLPLSYAHNDEGEVTYQTATLIRDDITDFIKRLRSYIDYHFGYKIRTFYCGEYGSKSKRPHYHFILFGLPYSDEYFKPFKYQKKGSLLLEIPFLTKEWGKGNCPVGELTFDSAAYVAGYMLKKVKGKEAKYYYVRNGIIPEFSGGSRRPGIAGNYFDMFSDSIYESDSLGLKLKGNLVARPPSYFDRLFKENHQDEMYVISAKRKLSSDEAWKLRELDTGIFREQLLKGDEDNLKARLSLSQIL